MPKTRGESFIFTAVTAWMMVYIMTLYNTVLASGHFTNHTFLTALQEMWGEFILIFLCAFFISGPLAKKNAFKIVSPDDRPLLITLAIQLFMVIFQVAFASILGVYHAGGMGREFLPCYFSVYCRNFLMALPVQVLLVGPAARKIFRCIFRRKG